MSTNAPTIDSRTYAERERDRSQRHSQEQWRSGRDIGPLPSIVDPERRASCERSLKLFCETYLPTTFSLEWADGHIVAIEKMEAAILQGGQFALAMPRGSGKTALVEAATLWAMLYGHRRFPFIVGSDAAAAKAMLDSLRIELEHNDLLLEDFPEACHPIRKLEGIAQRSKGQLLNGERTMVAWTADELVLPTVPGSPASGATVRVAGITGRIRGAKAKTAGGETIRPDLVLIDDPQTEESARSPSQVENREGTIRKAILGLAGPDTKIAAMAAVTVIEEGDLADRLLDRERNPEWQGERTRMLESFPDRMDLWEEYDKLRLAGLDADGSILKATRFYEENREAMDSGARVSWEARKNHDEASAIQHAMNEYLRDPEAFWSEYQNEPRRSTSSGIVLTAERVLERIGPLQRWAVPNEATYVTAAIDVQRAVLYYLVTAWTTHGSGWVVAYGAEPEQQRTYWTLRDAKRTLVDVHGGTWEAALERGLGSLAERLIGRELVREDGTSARVERCAIDAGWGESTEAVYRFIRRSSYGSVIMPVHGRAVGASGTPFADLPLKPGERRGTNWRVMPPKAGYGLRYGLYDANWWKSWIAARVTTPRGEPGALEIHAGTEREHRMLADHWTAEQPIETSGRGRQVDEWKIRQVGQDNHWWDCMVMSSVAASMLGVQVSLATVEGEKVDAPTDRPRKRKRFKMSERVG